MLASGARACDFTAAATTLRESNMRWGIVTAAVIAVTRSLWSLIVDRTISKHRGRPMRTRTVFSLALSLLPFGGSEAFAAERRVALVIGNSSYIHAPALDNPVNDVTAVSVMLEGAGFQVVETRNNLDNTAMRRVIREFSAKTRDAMSRWCSMPVTGWRSTAPTT